MAEDKIDSYIDRNGIKGDTDYILEALNRVFKGFKDIEGIKVDFRGFEGLSKITPAMQQSENAAKQLAEATKTVEQRIASMNGHSKEFTVVLEKQLKAQTEAAKATLLQAKADTEAARAQSIRNKEGEKTVKQMAQEKKAIDEVANDYLQLSRAYNEAALKAKNYALRLGEQHPITVQAVKDANDMSVVLKRIDASVGQHQRNVGNYASAFNGLGMSFAQVARELPSLSISVQQFALAVSNNLPMVADELRKAKVEIAALKAEGKDAPSLFSRIGSSLFSWQVGLSVGITLLTVYAKQLTNFFSSLFNGSKAINEARRQQELLNEVQKEANKNAGDDIGKLEALYKVSTNTALSIKERKKATDELQKTYPEHFKNVNDDIILQGKATAAYNATKDAILASAQAFAIQSKLSALATQELDLLKEETELTNNLALANGNLQKQKKKAADEAGESLRRTGSSFSTTTTEGDKLAVLNAEVAGYRARLKANIDFQNRLTKDREFYLNRLKAAPVTPDTGGGGGSDKVKDDAGKKLQILSAIRKIELQQDVDFAKEQLDNEQLSLVERLKALKVYYRARTALIDFEASSEKSVGKKTAEEIALIDAEQSDKKIRLDRETYAERERLLNEFSKKFTEDAKRALAATEKAIDEAYKRFQDAEKKRLEFEKETSKKRIENAEQEAEVKKRLQQQLVTELTNLAATLGAAGLEREKNAIQEQIDLLEAKKQKDIEVANQTIANAQERAAAIATIEARANAEKEQLQRRQRDLDVKKAQFDKAKAIAGIIQETAQNVVKYFGTPLALLAGAIGAIQLATVVAQPIPRYKHGKNVGDLYEGPAIVDDGGKPEAIIRENGDVEIGGNKPRLTHVGKRDIVLPDANMLVNYVLAGHMGGRLAVKPATKPQNDNVERKLDEVVKAIKGQKHTEIKAGEGALTQVVKFGASQIKYINDQTNW